MTAVGNERLVTYKPTKPGSEADMLYRILDNAEALGLRLDMLPDDIKKWWSEHRVHTKPSI